MWHNGLLAKLSRVGVEGSFLDTVRSYLAGRQQVVVVDGVKSDVLDVKAGVPQGSRLGPLLFIIYINDIADDIDSDILIFADDTSLVATYKINETKRVESNLSNQNFYYYLPKNILTALVRHQGDQIQSFCACVNCRK